MVERKVGGKRMPEIQDEIEQEDANDLSARFAALKSPEFKEFASESKVVKRSSLNKEPTQQEPEVVEPSEDTGRQKLLFVNGRAKNRKELMQQEALFIKKDIMERIEQLCMGGKGLVVNTLLEMALDQLELDGKQVFVEFSTSSKPKV
ncbi:hypothetical protein [Dongshaea marina]|uniref:hypothetical protein n=1 Tax=Dongshaea marina TaxID=2047966 RepID=UPI000D3E569D|nr:hypothetical protein [Dongshaea marina]